MGVVWAGRPGLAAPVDYASLAADVLQYASVALTSAQIKNLVASPVTLIAAPGANKFIELISVVSIYSFGTAAYTSGDANCGIYYGTSSTYQALSFSFVSNPPALPWYGSASSINFTSAIGAVTSADLYAGGSVMQHIPLAGVVNQALSLLSPTTNFASGDGTAIIHLIYRVHSSIA